MGKRGSGLEYAIRDLYRASGWLAWRLPASLGIADVLAIRAGDPPHLVECKTDRDTPWHNFPPKRRAELLAAAIQGGAVARLAWSPNGTSWGCFIDSGDWP